MPVNAPHPTSAGQRRSSAGPPSTLKKAMLKNKKIKPYLVELSRLADRQSALTRHVLPEGLVKDIYLAGLKPLVPVEDSLKANKYYNP